VFCSSQAIKSDTAEKSNNASAKVSSFSIGNNLIRSISDEFISPKRRLSRIASIRRLGEDAKESVNLINNLQCVGTQHFN
jgi:hypothetical protein